MQQLGLIKLILVCSAALTGCSSSTAPVIAIAPEEPLIAQDASRLIEVAVDSDMNGVPDTIYKLEFDCNGLAVAERIDENADSRDDERFLYTYANNRLIRSALDIGINGSIESVRRFNYNAAGVLQSEMIDDGNDGLINRRIDYLSSKADILA